MVVRTVLLGIVLGIASYYASRFHGRLTSSGERYNQNLFTAACNVVPIGTRLKVTNLDNKREVIVKVNDRIAAKRLIDLSLASARQLGILKQGLARVKIEVWHKK